MLALKKIAVTGSLSAGKTSVCRVFKKLGACVVSSDEIVHQLLSSHAPLMRKIVQLLGSEVLVNEKPDRKKIAEIVFSQPEKLKTLEALIHPLVYEAIEARYAEAKTKGLHDFFVAEVPLLFETDAQKFFDFSIAVVANPDQCKERFQQQTGHSTTDYDARMKRQLKDKETKADFILVNNGTLEDLEKKVLNLANTLKRNIYR